MTDHLRSKYYTRKRMFVAHMRRMFANCRRFNEPDTEYYKCADNLEEYVDGLLTEKGLDEG